jgi:hypothetical protein
MCQTMHSKALQGHPAQVMCQDKAGENIKWKIEFDVKCTARTTPQ